MSMEPFLLRSLMFLYCCCCSVGKWCLTATPWTAVCQASLSFTISWSLLKFMSIELVMLSNDILCHPPSPFAFSLSQYQGLFQWLDPLYHMAKVLELQCQHQSFQRIFKADFLEDWCDLLTVQGTLKSLPQHCNSKASVLRGSAFLMVNSRWVINV